MALYKGTALSSLVIGKLGDHIFQRWRNQKVVKMAEISVADPNTLAQQAVRNAVGTASSDWNLVLTDAERTSWNKYAQLLPNFRKVPAGIRQIIPGSYANVTGKDCYCMVAVWCTGAGLAVPLVAPLSEPAPIGIDDLVLTYNVGLLSLTYAWTADPLQVPLSWVRCWVYSPQHLWHKQILTQQLYTGLGAGVVDVAAAGGGRVPWNTFPGARVMAQVDVLTPAGRKSGGSNTVEIYLP